MAGAFISSSEVLVVVFSTLDPSLCITTPSTPRLLLTIQILSTGHVPESYPRTHLFQMLTENGEPDRLQSIINTIEQLIDTDTESLDMFLGTAA